MSAPEPTAAAPASAPRGGRLGLRLGLRLLWLVVQLTLVIWFIDAGARFLYQGY